MRKIWILYCKQAPLRALLSHEKCMCSLQTLIVEINHKRAVKQSVNKKGLVQMLCIFGLLNWLATGLSYLIVKIVASQISSESLTVLKSSHWWRGRNSAIQVRSVIHSVRHVCLQLDRWIVPLPFVHLFRADGSTCSRCVFSSHAITTHPRFSSRRMMLEK